LEKSSDLTVVGEAHNGQISVTKALELRPQVVLMDIGLPDIEPGNREDACAAHLGEAGCLRSNSGSCVGHKARNCITASNHLHKNFGKVPTKG
jgi:CheY-like chemotaxis protein